jgi:ATP-dependent Lon protease
MTMPLTNEDHAATETASVPIPADALIIVPVRNTVLFPGVVAPITIARPKSIAAAQQALREQRPIGILLQRNVEVNDPGPEDLNRICTIANIVRYITGPDETHHIICQGVQRAFLISFLARRSWRLGFFIFRSPRQARRK